MAKYFVKSYYTYVAVAEVEAETPQQALEEGYNINEGKFTDELEFCGYTDSEVVDEQFNVVLTDNM
jgi:hypothetical protein